MLVIRKRLTKLYLILFLINYRIPIPRMFKTNSIQPVRQGRYCKAPQNIVDSFSGEHNICQATTF
jgi:hypothetical protein